jgi:hypothetical protein
MRYGLTFAALLVALAACSDAHDSRHAKPASKSGSKADSSGKGSAGEDGARSDGGMGEGDEGDEGDGESEADRNLGAPLTYYHDVKPIMDAKCMQCHYDGGIAPVAFTGYDAVHDLAQLIRADVASGKMPPWRAAGPLDEYIGDRRLTEKQKDTIVRWVKQGAAAGDPADAPPPLVAVERGLPRVDLKLPMHEAYTPTAQDDYRCFLLGWPFDEKKYITGLGIEPDNKKTVHHAILYLIAPDQVQAAIDRENEDDIPGYSCFGSGLDPWLTSYEPGGFGEEVPGGLGFEIAPGSELMLQVHYNTLNDDGPDKSHVELMLEDEVDRVGDVALIMRGTWPAGGMPIPANNPDVMHSWRGRPSNLQADTAYDLYWADLHMHALGSRGGIAIVRAGTGEVVPLLEIPDWAFEWQETFLFREPVRLQPYDQLMVECHFDNTAPNQLVVQGKQLVPRDLNWGEGTTDEMCLGNVLATPVQEAAAADDADKKK